MILPGEVVCHLQHFLAVTLPIIATGLCHAAVNWLFWPAARYVPPNWGRETPPGRSMQPGDVCHIIVLWLLFLPESTGCRNVEIRII